MASERFYRLPQEKQQCIRDAALEEFTRVPFEKVSINKIIQKAGISRGSFYTYFEDSRDLLKYLMEDILIRSMEFCRNTLEKYHGDYWKMMEEFLSVGIEWYSSKNFREIIRSAVTNQSFGKDIWDINMKKNSQKCHESYWQWLLENADWKDSKIKTIEDIQILLEVHMMAVVTAIGQTDERPEEKDRILRKYHMKVNMIKHGIFEQDR